MAAEIRLPSRSSEQLQWLIPFGLFAWSGKLGASWVSGHRSHRTQQECTHGYMNIFLTLSTQK